MIVSASEGSPLLGPHGLYDLECLFELLHPCAGRGKIVAVGPVFRLLPPRANAKDESPAAQKVKGRTHLGEEGWVAEGLAEHGMAKREIRMPRSHVRQRGKAFQHIGIVGQEVIDAPSRVEMSGGQVQGAVE